jgi:hypothetical protein
MVVPVIATTFTRPLKVAATCYSPLKDKRVRKKKREL